MISKVGESLLVPHIKTSEIGNYMPRVNRLRITVKQRNEKWLRKRIWPDLVLPVCGDTWDSGESCVIKPNAGDFSTCSFCIAPDCWPRTLTNHLSLFWHFIMISWENHWWNITMHSVLKVAIRRWTLHLQQSLFPYWALACTLKSCSNKHFIFSLHILFPLLSRNRSF